MGKRGQKKNPTSLYNQRWYCLYTSRTKIKDSGGLCLVTDAETCVICSPAFMSCVHIGVIMAEFT